jgi:hypothetical protein
VHPQPKDSAACPPRSPDLVGGGLKRVLPSLIADVQELARVIQKKERDEAADWEELQEALRTAQEWKPR